MKRWFLKAGEVNSAIENMDLAMEPIYIGYGPMDLKNETTYLEIETMN